MDNKDNQDISTLLKNQSLKLEFASRNLDLDEVFLPVPDDLERENRVLQNLLDWVEQYTKFRDRNWLEANDYLFPPIWPAISPENDWYRFKEWIHGHALSAKLKEQMLVDYVPKNPKLLTDEEIYHEVESLLDHMAKINVQVDLQAELPPRLLYEYLLKRLEDRFDILVDGMWHIDGCSGYCPGCFQRPWCESGQGLCWREDEEAGKMAVPDIVEKYVSASPISLQLLQERQAEEDRRFEEFKKSQHDDDDIDIPF